MPDQVAIREVKKDDAGTRHNHFAICEPVGFAIPNGQTGSLVAAALLPANSRVIGIVVADTGGIAAQTNISAEISFDNEPTSPMATLYEQDDPSLAWSKGAIPTSGSFAFILTHAFRARRIRFILSVNATAVVTFNIYGLDGVT